MPAPDSGGTIPTEVWAIPLDDVDDLPRLAGLIAELDDAATNNNAG